MVAKTARAQSVVDVLMNRMNSKKPMASKGPTQSFTPSTDGASIDGFHLNPDNARTLLCSVLIRSPAGLLALLSNVKNIKSGEFTARVVVSEGRFAYRNMVPHMLDYFDPNFSGLVAQEESASRTHLLVGRLAAQVYINPAVKDFADLQFQVTVAHLEGIVAGNTINVDFVRLDYNGEVLRVTRISPQTGRISRFSSMPTQVIMNQSTDTISNHEYAWHVIIPTSDIRRVLETADRAEFKTLRITILKNLISSVHTLFFIMATCELYDEVPLELQASGKKANTYITTSSSAVLGSDAAANGKTSTTNSLVKTTTSAASAKVFETYMAIDQFAQSTGDAKARSIHLYLNDGCTIITHIETSTPGLDLTYNVAFLDDEAAGFKGSDVFYSLL
jgi:hypothetical protein